MASSTLLSCVLLFLYVAVPVITADPEPLQDFCVADTAASSSAINGLQCLDPTKASPKHFMTSLLGVAGNTSATGISVSLITPQIMPSINTLGLTMARFDIAPGAVVPPHTHPRASEIVYVQQGTLIAGFVDTNNKVFSSQIKTGDVFMFPKAIVHYLQNTGSTPAVFVGAFNSQNPGTSLVALATFASTPAIPDDILAKTFQITPGEVQIIRKKFGG